MGAAFARTNDPKEGLEQLLAGERSSPTRRGRSRLFLSPASERGEEQQQGSEDRGEQSRRQLADGQALLGHAAGASDIRGGGEKENHADEQRDRPGRLADEQEDPLDGAGERAENSGSRAYRFGFVLLLHGRGLLQGSGRTQRHHRPHRPGGGRQEPPDPFWPATMVTARP